MFRIQGFAGCCGVYEVYGFSSNGAYTSEQFKNRLAASLATICKGKLVIVTTNQYQTDAKAYLADAGFSVDRTFFNPGNNTVQVHSRIN